MLNVLFAGDNSWEPSVHPEYQIAPGVYQWTTHMLCLDGQHDVAKVVNRTCDTKKSSSSDHLHEDMLLYAHAHTSFEPREHSTLLTKKVCLSGVALLAFVWWCWTVSN